MSQTIAANDMPVTLTVRQQQSYAVKAQSAMVNAVIRGSSIVSANVSTTKRRKSPPLPAN